MNVLNKSAAYRYIIFVDLKEFGPEVLTRINNK